MAPIAVGDTIPDGNLNFINQQGEFETLSLYSIITGKKVFLLGVSGAFLPDSRWLQAPEVFQETYNIDSAQETICICVNDPYVVKGWEWSYFRNNTHVKFLADTTAAYVASLGLEIDLTSAGFGVRCKSFGMVLEDRKVVQFRQRNPRRSWSSPSSVFERPTSDISRAPIAAGDIIPDGMLTFINHQSQIEPVSMHSIVTSKKVIVLGVRGSFLAVSKRLVRSFIEKAHVFNAMGVHAILCISVNDTYVMREWRRTYFKRDEHINFLADPTAAYVTSLGLANAHRELGMRSKRFAMLLEDRRVEAVEVHRFGDHMLLARDMLVAMARKNNQTGLHQTGPNPQNTLNFFFNFSPHPCESMPLIAGGDTIPDGNLNFVNEEGGFDTVSIYSIITDKKVLVVGVIGAFMPHCSWWCIPEFIWRTFNSRSSQETLIISVDDPYVVRGWKMACFPRNNPHLKFLADSDAAYVTSLGLSLDLTSRGFGVRSRSFAMLLEDRKVVEYGEFRKDWDPPLPIVERPTPNVSRTPIAVGDIIPDGTLTFINQQNQIEPVSIHSIVTGKEVVIFGVRGAFLHICSEYLVSSFIEQAIAFKSAGVQEILCISVNDPFAMWGWKLTCFKDDKHIKFLADSTAAYVTSLGLEDDLSDMGHGIRSRMFGLLLEDCRVKEVGIDIYTAKDMYKSRKM